MSATPQFSQEQLTAARLKAWRQDGDAAVTLESAREWLSPLGLVAFAPKPNLTAPSFVEATIGAATPEPTPEQIHLARGLLSRMVTEGTALPMNLGAIPGEMPDFVVTAQVFSYLFTLRGDKVYKVAPQDSGTFAVTPLAVKVYEVLAARGALSAAEVATDLGRELTEAAALRALGELWGKLRVLPLYGQDADKTLWELTTRRFLKPIKAGANAGVPTALSALISLYLGQAVAASEEQIAAFLNDVAAGSRVHEVLTALTTAREIETLAVNGQTLLYVSGSLPEFAEPALEIEATTGEEPAEGDVAAQAVERIRSFDSGRSSELRGKPVRRTASSPRAPREGKESERERRPFERKAGAARPARAGGAFGASKPRRAAEGSAAPRARRDNAFTKPWDEDRAAAAKPSPFDRYRKEKPELGPREEKGLPPEKRRYERKPASEAGAERAPRDGAYAKKPYAKKPFGAKPFGDRPPREGGEGKPFGAKQPYEKKPYAKKPYAAKPFGAKPFGERAPREEGERKPFAAKKFAAKKPGGFGARKFEGAPRSYGKREREGGEAGPAARPTSRPSSRPGGFGAAKRPGGFGATKRPGWFGGSRPAGEGELPSRSTARPGGYAGAKSGSRRPGGAPGGRPGGFGAKPGARPVSRPGTKFGARPAGRPGTKFGSRPGGKFTPKPGAFRPPARRRPQEGAGQSEE